MPLGTVKIICLGAAVIDRVYAVNHIPSTPQKVQAHDCRDRCGGIAATAAVAIARLGHLAVFWGRLGDDAGAALILAALERHGVAIGAVRCSPGGKTPSAAVIVDAQGERLLAAFPGSGLEDNPDWLPLGDLAGADALLVDTRWPQGALHALRAARSRGLPSVLDADLGDPALLASLTEQASHSIFSALGLERLTGLNDAEAGLRAAQDLTSGLVGVTLGADGTCWLAQGELHRQSAFSVLARDTTGAGDTFHGAYALAIAQEKSIEQAMRYAAAAAAIKVRCGEGWDGMPDPAAIEQLLRSEET
jgi:sulfofructose kinase